MSVLSFDDSFIQFLRRISIPLFRISIFIIFFWFGILKLIGISPAGALVQDLYMHTLPLISFKTFYLCFALFECLIGVMFLVKGLERIVIPLLFLHMITTILPLIFLPDIAWQAPFVPTLEGQYIIKNLAIVAAAVGIAAHLHPLHAVRTKKS